MSSRALVLRPKRRPFEHALAAYRKADLDDAILLLHGNDEARAVVLRVRCLLRLGRFQHAAEELCDVALDGPNAAVRAEVNVLQASIASRREGAAFDEALQDAEEALVEKKAAGLRAEVAFIKARNAWAHGALDAAESSANDCLAIESDDASSIQHVYHTRALALELLGLIAADREQFDVAAVRYREAMAEIDGAPFRDEWIAASITMNVAVLARDFPWAADAVFLEERIDRVRWTTALSARRFLCLHGLGWCRAHEGDHLGALRAFHDAADIAPSIPLKVTAWVDHAMLGRELGSDLVAQESTCYAADLASSIDWRDVRNGERFALLFLAEALAADDVRLAREVMKRYDDVDSPIDTLMSGDTNRMNARALALEYRAEALIARGEGRVPHARRLFRDEYAIWSRLGSEPRAAIAALDAYRFDNDPALLEFARRAAASTPLSWVARRVATYR